jgi:ubiquitin-conjugating enzyme E2 Z
MYLEIKPLGLPQGGKNNPNPNPKNPKTTIYVNKTMSTKTMSKKPSKASNVPKGYGKVNNGMALKRITRELSDLFKEPLPGIMIDVSEENMSIVDVLIMGPEGTPYECGFFYFKMWFPNDYPSTPPKVETMTTGSGKVRFNPNLYNNGKVCLSILGTWGQSSWSPCESLSSVLLALQAQVMVENPLKNEPVYYECKDKTKLQAYNDVIIHETVRVALCDFLENKTGAPQNFVDIAREIYLSKDGDEKESIYEKALKICDTGKKMDGKKSHTCQNHITFNHKASLKKLQKLKKELSKKDKF